MNMKLLGILVIAVSALIAYVVVSSMLNKQQPPQQGQASVYEALVANKNNCLARVAQMQTEYANVNTERQQLADRVLQAQEAFNAGFEDYTALIESITQPIESTLYATLATYGFKGNACANGTSCSQDQAVNAAYAAFISLESSMAAYLADLQEQIALAKEQLATCNVTLNQLTANIAQAKADLVKQTDLLQEYEARNSNLSEKAKALQARQNNIGALLANIDQVQNELQALYDS